MPSEAFYRIAQQPSGANAEYARRAQAFDDSFYRDSEGNMAGIVNMGRGFFAWTANTPSNLDGYGLWRDPGTDAYLLRKPDRTESTQRYNVTNVTSDRNGIVYSVTHNRNTGVDNKYIGNNYDRARASVGGGYMYDDGYSVSRRPVFDPKPEAPTVPQTLLAKQQRVTGSGVIQGAADKGSATSAAATAPAPSAQRFEQAPTDNRTMTRLENFGVTADTYKAMPYEQKVAAVNAALTAEQQAMIEGFNAAKLKQQAPTYDASRK